MIRNRTGANARGTPRLPPSAAVGPITSDDVINTSTVPGATVTDALDALAGAGVLQSWASTLAVGSVSGGVSPQVSDTDNLEFLAATPVATTGRIRAAQGFGIFGRDAGNAANATLLDWGTVADTLVVGGSSFPTVVNSADAFGLALATGAVARLTLSAAMALLSVSPLQFASAVTTPTVNQAATGGATGEPLTVQAQNAVTTGGDVVVSSGTGVTAGNVDLRTGGISRLLARPVAVDLNVPLLQFLSGVTAPAISQETTGGAAGQPLAITAQAAATTGGNVVLSGGAGGTTQGSVDIANDSPLRFTGASPVALTGDMRLPQDFNWNIRNNANTADLNIVGLATVITFGNTERVVRIDASTGGVQLRPNGGNGLLVSTTSIEAQITPLEFRDNVNAPVIRHAPTASGAGETLTFHSQDTTDATANGGGLAIRSGSGGATSGESGPLTIDTPDSVGQSGDLTIKVGDVSTAEVRAGTLSVLGGDGGGGEGGVGGTVIVQPGIGGSVTTAGRIELNHAGGNTAIDIAQQANAHLGGQAILITNAGLAFFDGAPTEKPSVTGSRDSNAALASLMAELDDMGLVTDDTTPT